MKNLYLHIGSHKTGTTSIQNTLYRIQETIGEQDYNFFCKTMNGQDIKSGNGSIGWFLKDKNFQKRIFDGLGLQFTNSKLFSQMLSETQANNIIFFS